MLRCYRVLLKYCTYWLALAFPCCLLFVTFPFVNFLLSSPFLVLSPPILPFNSLFQFLVLSSFHSVLSAFLLPLLNHSITPFIHYIFLVYSFTSSDVPSIFISFPIFIIFSFHYVNYEYFGCHAFFSNYLLHVFKLHVSFFILSLRKPFFLLFHPVAYSLFALPSPTHLLFPFFNLYFHSSILSLHLLLNLALLSSLISFIHFLN